MIIKATVDQITEGNAILNLDNDTSIVLPLEKLPTGITKGSVLIMEILTDTEHEEKNIKKAKVILNELLDVTP